MFELIILFDNSHGMNFYDREWKVSLLGKSFSVGYSKEKILFLGNKKPFRVFNFYVSLL